MPNRKLRELIRDHEVLHENCIADGDATGAKQVDPDSTIVVGVRLDQDNTFVVLEMQDQGRAVRKILKTDKPRLSLYLFQAVKTLIENGNNTLTDVYDIEVNDDLLA